MIPRGRASWSGGFIGCGHAGTPGSTRVVRQQKGNGTCGHQATERWRNPGKGALASCSYAALRITPEPQTPHRALKFRRGAARRMLDKSGRLDLVPPGGDVCRTNSRRWLGRVLVRAFSQTKPGDRHFVCRKASGQIEIGTERISARKRAGAGAITLWFTAVLADTSGQHINLRAEPGTQTSIPSWQWGGRQTGS